MTEILLTTCHSPNHSEKNLESIHIQDLRTGTLLGSFKNNSSSSNCTTLLGSEFIASIQSDSTTLHFWSWKKSQTYIKSTLPEKAGSICASHDGQFCVVGGVSGMMYLWEVATGNLLNSWEGHYKKVNCVQFVEDDSFVISGGEDAIVNVWNLTSIIMNSGFTDGTSTIRPLLSWSEHSLPVTAIYCGFGGVNGRIVTTSMDRTCKMWDIPTGSMLCSIIFPTGLTCVCMDSGESVLYVGGTDGKIYSLNLFSAQFLTESHLNKDNSQFVFQGHSQGITSIGLSWDGLVLVSGSLDGTVRLWNTRSRQSIKSFSNHKGAITSVMVSERPIDMLDSEKKIVHPLQTLKKYRQEDESVVSFLPVNLNLKAPSLDEITESSQSTQTIMKYFEAAQDSFLASSDPELNTLKEANRSLMEENTRWKKINNELYGFCINELVNSENK